MSRPAKEIRCSCELCQGKPWTLADIRALPNFPTGKPINGKMLDTVNRATSHKFYYPESAARGDWKRPPTRRGAKSDDRLPHRYGSDPEAREIGPVNSRLIGAADGLGEVTL